MVTTMIALVLIVPQQHSLEIWDFPKPEPTPIVTDMARKVSYCESGDNNIRNLQGSSASGYFQFVDSTWEWLTGLPAPAMSYDYETQLEAFLTLWNNGEGARHWYPSRTCWEHPDPWSAFNRQMD